ncbi:FAD-binding domain-containing protein [Roridomyces roridus]|uniref:FAD-binding domain-containing protein n=1 Tax=Roridomyces roridus TaxID=1738132 RepID=A0AAD7FI85_9AGAR|nr:FAD-binding domain-containing protein [Roridomyces roridus]
MSPIIQDSYISMKWTSFTIVLLYALLGHSLDLNPTKLCRNIPGSQGYPDAAAWSELNATVAGRLVNVVPSAKFCNGTCSDAQWTSALFRNTIPGAMDQPNWEQGYDLTPPSLCLRNSSNTCGQGDVPLFSVEAETVEDVQAAVKFASKYNLRLVVKSSGHDYLGRSTAPNSLLIRTTHLRNVTFTDNFFVGGKNLGSAVTAGSGVPAQTVYQEAESQGKIAVLGTAATVCLAGGYLQGGGHSALSPLFGLAVDNALEFHVVVASGELLQVNSESHPDLFYALRGGGPGSWGVVISATVKMRPTFNATRIIPVFVAANNTAAAALATVHAEHIFDFDSVHAGQYFYLLKNSTDPNAPTLFEFITYFPNNTTPEQGQALLAPFLNASLAIPGVELVSMQQTYADINSILFSPDDAVGDNEVLGSRLIPEAAYHDPTKVGEVYKELLDTGSLLILGHLVAGGQVAKNADISSAVNPAWRSAKTHLILVNQWPDSTPLSEISTIRNQFQSQQLPILEKMSGPDAGSYSNEADVLEPHFQTTFFGPAPNYAKLSAIKSRYDPGDLFIVGAGVGSERWDEWGLCRK